ncbi:MULTISPECIES: conjugation system SOS inhibitor PsiB [Enterobacteriaceae]|uniref:conjugation system SOS inhibitor PsiB n=1 Tax=Enterobacteriaceae TaxID=543 RepID=UPI0012C62BE0|nr:MULTISPECIES: conjugation system SOS inhibitor PsiB [Enterobacteriaceae]EBD1309280.1 conjugation system SOS inhibitor PsiB [Salmonella enterica subsp. enterica serovar Mbandaka]EBI9728719.1 conjugation system SOS inhibitor PsiB [Salmonella enterica]ECB6441168.1 conjugation system SOS inhibitor PsiB [Salmonella enterica subsp. enterica serovar Typhimurium]ECK7470271.1 conjugation system SOS inhibitor PsiB [Salmonella enterica subsp. enterica serovar Minnesota]ECS9208318.1 conjugation system 
MRNIITTDVLKTMIPSEFEDYRNGGNDLRRALTHAVLGKVDAPSGWNSDCEYNAEYGGLFPVQCRFTPAHEHFHIVLCSPGDVSPVWLMVFVSDNGHPVSVVRTLAEFNPQLISHTLSLTARLDSDGYAADFIIHTLAMEGAR